MLDTRPIGVFDSGLGGLCAVKELVKLMPSEDIVYFGDTSRVPYGNRSKEIITRYAKQDIRFLLTHDVKIIVIACGTISSSAMEELQTEFPNKKIVGVVEGSCESAIDYALNREKKSILVLATAATIATDIYKKTIHSLNSDFSVLNKACPLFVPLVENGYIAQNNMVTHLIAEEYLTEYKDIDLGAVILGCTHYPMIKEIIADILPSPILVDSGYEAAIKAKSLIEQYNLQNTAMHKGTLSVYVSDEVHNFTKIASSFLGTDISTNISKINIENY